MGFADMIASVVVLKYCAISHKESPDRILYEHVTAGHGAIRIATFLINAILQYMILL
jgi:hypothetical protein